jgi:phosphoribosylglycinamide formyltransferase-1
MLRADQVELVLCAGWLKKLVLPADFEGKVLNVHPSLLPDFGGPGMYGRAVHEAVLAAGCSESGCTIHYVNAEYDQGPILWQQRVNIEDCTTAEAIQARVTAAEKIAYPEAIRRHFRR